MSKYKLAEESINHDGITLFRIEALIDFNDVKKGDKGGFVEEEANLSHYGNAWVYGDAWVSCNAQVYGNARVYGDAWVSCNAQVSGDAQVYGNARVSCNAQVSGDAQVYGNALIENIRDILWLSIVGSENGTLTVYKSKDKNIQITRGCFSGTLEEFKEAVTNTHGNNEFAQEYLLVIELIKNRFKEDA